MNEKPTFDDVRRDVEERQKSILWEDSPKGGRRVDAFLWKGDPNAKPVQRAGLAVFGFMFLLLAVAIASIPFQKPSGEGWGVDFAMAVAALLISLRLFRNALLKGRKRTEQRDKEQP